MSDRAPLTIALDMDGVVYDCLGPWTRWLAETHGETITPDQITTWDFHTQVKCGVKVYDFLDTPGAFLDMQAAPGAIAAINYAHGLGVRQFFVSTIKTRQGAWEKQQAIARDFPYLANDVLITSGSKDLIRADVLVDDGPHNLEAFSLYGLTCKVPYKYNAHVETDFVLVQWSEYPKLVEYLLSQEVK